MFADKKTLSFHLIQPSYFIKIYGLLSVWPEIKPAVVIELLGAQHFDIEVRNFAVKCLDKLMKDEDVQAYLLQLTQVIHAPIVSLN